MLVVHRHVLVREAVAAALAGVVRVAGLHDGQDVGVDVRGCDVVLIEQRLLLGDGPWSRRCAEQGAAPFVVLSDEGPTTAHELERALAAGARAWVPFDASAEHVAEVVLVVASRRPWTAPEPRSALEPLGRRPVHLTARETSVLQLLTAGKSTRDISVALGLAPNTVRTYRQRLFHKLDVHSAVEAVVRSGSEPADRDGATHLVTDSDGVRYVVPGSGSILLGGTGDVDGLPTVPDMHRDAPLHSPGSSTAVLQERDATSRLRAAAAGDRTAWADIVDSYVGLVWSVARSCGLSPSDTSDIAQTTWLRLVENIDRIEDPERLGAWLATTARRECLRLIARSRRTTPVAGVEALSDTTAPPAPSPDAGLLARERDEQVREAITRLPPHCQRLLEQLMADPRPSYSEIAARLQMPIGSIGPTRGRCLRRLQELLSPGGLADSSAAVWEGGAP